MDQLTLFETKWTKYHKENPQVWEKFKEFTLRTIEKGFTHYGSKGIFELIRWHTGTTGNDGFKVNNNYTPFYVRLFERTYPQHKGFFRKRKSKADNKL